MTEKKSEKDLEVLGRQMDEKIKKLLGRSLSIREVDTGSCNACEVEVNALSNSIYDIERFGLKIVASPRFADMLMITGPVTRNMEHPLLQTFNATPNPKIVVALGGCAISGGLFADTYACSHGVSSVVPVDVFIPGCPPRPQAIIQGIMVALDLMESNMKKDPKGPSPRHSSQ